MLAGWLQVPAGAESFKVKVRMGVNLHGLAVVEGVQSVEEYEDAAPAPEVGTTSTGRVLRRAPRARGGSNASNATPHWQRSSTAWGRSASAGVGCSKRRSGL